MQIKHYFKYVKKEDDQQVSNCKKCNFKPYKGIMIFNFVK